MNKKILIGSIIAVAILILVSFTGVVGYQTTKSSNIAKASPLFTIRSSRAVDKDSKDITCSYVGKGEKCLLSIPKLDTRYQKGIDIIQHLDDKSYDRLIDLAIRMLNSRYTLQEYDIVEITQLVNQYRNNPNMINQNPIKEEPKPSVADTTNCDCEPITFQQLGSCLYYLIVILIIIYEEIQWFLVTLLQLPPCLSE